MSFRPPAEIGMTLDEVDTPALVVDLDILEKNLHRMASLVGNKGPALRPHAKTHKCPVLALRQIALGAVGVCCQKVDEAEAMVSGGVPDILITNEIVGKTKLRRLALLARRARVGVCVDHPENVAALEAAARELGVTLRVLVEIDVGANRCGVAPGEPAVVLARQIEEAPSLVFGGLQAYQGAAQHIREFTWRREAIAQAVEKVEITVAALEKAGLRAETITGAGTGSFAFEAASGVYTELQAGSYVFMDADYGRNLGKNGKPVREFGQSLFILTTVMSRPGDEWAVVDAGLKAQSVDSGLPLVEGLPGVTYLGASDEHGKLDTSSSKRPLRHGEKIRLIPGHCDPTVNLYDWLVCVREGMVETLWPITARGAIR